MKLSLLLTLLSFIYNIHYIQSSESSLMPLAQIIINSTLTDCTIPKLLTFTDYNTIKRISANKISTMSFYHFVGKLKFTYLFNETYDIITTSDYFNPSQPTIIVLNGFFGQFYPGVMKTIIRNFISLANVNLFLLKDDVFMTGPYYYCSTGARIVGEALGELLAKLYLSGYGNFHLIGHSLGAHASGFAGKVFKKRTSVNLRRISGLDPAGPCFYYEPSSLRLTKTDADFVDVIHTNIEIFGIIDQLGHVDIYPNGGKLQPVCFFIGCSHLMSIDYYAESIINDQFDSIQCSDWDTFLSGNCNNNNRVNMGYWTPTTTRGVYFLETGDKTPFALGFF